MKLFLITILLLYSSVLYSAARYKFRTATFFVNTSPAKPEKEIWQFVPRSGILLTQALDRFDGYATTAELIQEQAVLGGLC